MKSIVVILKEDRMTFDPVPKLWKVKSACFLIDVVFFEDGFTEFFNKVMNTCRFDFNIILTHFKLQTYCIFIIVNLV